MREEEKPQFAVLITGIGEMYDKSFNPFLLELYWNVLKSYSFEEVKNGVNRYLANADVGMFFPKPADIIAVIEGDSKTKALLAWTKVMSAIKMVGMYNSIVFDDALIHAVIRDMGGWQKLCITKNDDFSFVGKEFQNRYRWFVNQKPTCHPSHLIGIAESKNGQSGFNFAPPVLFGDEAKAKQVLGVDIKAIVKHKHSYNTIPMDQKNET